MSNISHVIGYDIPGDIFQHMAVMLMTHPNNFTFLTSEVCLLWIISLIGYVINMIWNI